MDWIARAWAANNQAIIEIDGMWVMRRWEKRLSEWFVTPADAASIRKMRCAVTHEELWDVWRHDDVQIIKQQDDGENIHWDRYLWFYYQHTCVHGEPTSTDHGCVVCQCNIYCEDSLCSHQLSKYQCSAASVFRPIDVRLPAGRIPHGAALAAFVGRRARKPGRPGRGSARGRVGGGGRTGKRGRGRGRGLSASQQSQAHDGDSDAGMECDEEVDGDNELPEHTDSKDSEDEDDAIGLREVVIPKTLVKSLTDAFAASEAQRLVSACWWLRKIGGDWRQPELAHCVVTEHMTRDGTIVDTPPGHSQLASFLAAHPGLTVFGWCLVSPSCRRPSVTAAEIERAWTMQTRSLNRDIVLAVAWRAGKEVVSGARAYCLRHDKREELAERHGRIQDAQDSDEFLQPLPFKEFEQSGRLDFSWEGRWIGEAGSSRAVHVSRTMVASAIGQVAMDILQMLRTKREESGKCNKHIIETLVCDYTPPGGVLTVARFYEQVKDAVLQLRSEHFAIVSRKTRGDPVQSWLVQLKC